MEWRIFFVGPMQESTQVRAEAGSRAEPTTSTDHFSQMVAAVVDELRDHGYAPATVGEHRLTGGVAVPSLVLTRAGDGDRVTLIQPHDLFGPHSIHTNVFDAIDDADLVIADLTGLRPAVVYELALAHALGIWTLLLGSESDGQQMFYLKGYRHAVVTFGDADIRSAEFTTAFATWLVQRNKRFDSGNPFTDFYGAPIPDVSAASGLANGYYENFLSRVLAAGAEVVDRSDGPAERRGPVAGVLVVRPPGLHDLDDIVDSTGDILERAFGDRFRRGKRGSVFVDTNGHGDRTCEFVVDDWLIDVPRTVLSLERSPRLKRTAGRVERTEAHDHLSENLIERFLEVARSALDADRDIRRKKERFFYGSPAEIVNYLQQPPGKRPTVW
jgi:hypothetical protein